MTKTKDAAFRALFREYYGYHFDKSKPDYSRCAHEVCGTGRADRPHQCYNKNGYGPHGAYCNRHDPEVIKAKRAASDAFWQAERAAERKKLQFRDDCQAAVRAIAAGHNDPRVLCQSIIDRLEAQQ